MEFQSYNIAEQFITNTVLFFFSNIEVEEFLKLSFDALSFDGCNLFNVCRHFMNEVSQCIVFEIWTS